jgi:hypothetical protein
MTASVRQLAMRTQWLTELGELGRQIGGLTGPLNRGQLDWSPPEGGWGVGQVLEHLCMASVRWSSWSTRHLGQLERIRAQAAFPARA